MTQQPALSADTLLQHEPFVRAVVRGLLTDENRVHDVVQETWLTALRRPPREGGSLRAWLGRVAGNLARDSQRGASRRRRREAAAARPEATESVATTHERLAAQRDVVSHVLRLAEPYQSVVLLRYYQDLGAAEIGERLGRSAATVRSQLSRAHELLRDGLDREFDGGRVAWSGVLLPAALGESRRAAGTTTPLWSTTSAKLAAGVIVVAAAVVIVPRVFDADELSTPNASQVASSTNVATGRPQGLTKPKLATDGTQRAAAAIEPDEFDPSSIAEMSGRQLLEMAVQTERAIQRLVLTPEPELVEANAELLKLPNTGITRLLSGSEWQGIASHAILPRGGGTYFSFATQSHSFNSEPDLSFTGGYLSPSGRPGLLLEVGDIPLEALPMECLPLPHSLDRADTESWSTMWGEITTDDAKNNSAFRKRNEHLRGSPPAPSAITTYIVRSHNPDEHDHLVAFRTLGFDEQGCTISWRILKSWAEPTNRHAHAVKREEHPEVPVGPEWLHTQSLDQLLEFLAQVREHGHDKLFGVPDIQVEEERGAPGRSGVSRILHRFLWKPLVRIREGGAYLSFKTGSNAFDGNTDLSLEQGKFGAYAGYIADLGELTAAGRSVVMSGQSPAGLNASALNQLDFLRALGTTVAGGSSGERVVAGSDAAKAEALGLSRTRVRAVKGHTYVLRSALQDDHDLLVVFTAVADDEFGFTLEWRAPADIQPGVGAAWPPKALEQPTRQTGPPIGREKLQPARLSTLSPQQMLELAVQLKRQTEILLLTPDASIVQSCGSLLSLPNTGVVRILAAPGEDSRIDRLTLTPGNGGCYSFVNREHNSSVDGDLSFYFSALKASSRFGFLADVGDVPLAGLPEMGRELSPGLSVRSCEVWPLFWRELGVVDASYDSEFYNSTSGLHRRIAPTGTESTYLLRSFNPPMQNHLIAFRPLAVDADGCTLSWRLLKDWTLPTPRQANTFEVGRHLSVPTGPAWIEGADLGELEVLLDGLQTHGEERLLSAPDLLRARFEEAVGKSCAAECRLTRILPRHMWEPLLKVREGGSYLSFDDEDHAYNRHSDISSSSGGFDAGNGGIIQNLGEVPPDELSAVMLGAAPTTLDARGDETFGFLESVRASWRDVGGRPTLKLSPADEARAKEFGVQRHSVSAIVGHTYRLRTATHEEHDHLVVFTVIGGNERGYTLAYRVLRKWPVEPRPKRR